MTRCHLCYLSPCARTDASSPWPPLASPRVTCHLCAASSAVAASAARPAKRASARAPAPVRCGAPWALSSSHIQAPLSALVAPVGSFLRGHCCYWLSTALPCVLRPRPVPRRVLWGPGSWSRPASYTTTSPARTTPSTSTSAGSSRSLSKSLGPGKWQGPPLIGAATVPCRPGPMLLLCAYPLSACTIALWLHGAICLSLGARLWPPLRVGRWTLSRAGPLGLSHATLDLGDAAPGLATGAAIPW